MRKYLTPEDREVLRKLDQHRQGQHAYFAGLERALDVSRREIDVDMLADQVRHFYTPLNSVPIVYYSGTSSGSIALISGASINFGTNNGTWTIKSSGLIVPTFTGVAAGGGGAGEVTGDTNAGGGGGGGEATTGVLVSIVPGKVYTVHAGVLGAAGAYGADGTIGGDTSFVNTTDSVTLVLLKGGGPGLHFSNPGAGGTGGTGTNRVAGGIGGSGSPGGPPFDGASSRAGGGGGGGDPSNNGGAGGNGTSESGGAPNTGAGGNGGGKGGGWNGGWGFNAGGGGAGAGWASGGNAGAAGEQGAARLAA